MSKTKLVPFDIEKAKQGAEVVTRCGYPVKITRYNANSTYPIRAIVKTEDGYFTYSFTVGGRFIADDEESDYDLFIKEEVEEDDDYDPYKATVESIADMAERYSELQSLEELKDFYNNVRVKCQDAFEYGRVLEEKSNDRIEPKFKVGDFIVNEYCKGKVIEITNDAYLLDTGQGIPFSNNSTRLWNVAKDAKDGDVLYSGEVIFIFNRIKGEWIHCCCTLHRDGSFISENYDLMHIKHCKEVQPATKEQYDLLFQKMKEAGYEWDEEKKELKKIAPKFKVDDVMRTLEEANDDITEGLPVVISIDDDYYHCNNETIAIKDQDEYEYPPMNAKQKKTKTRRMTNQELSWWLIDCPDEYREVCRVDEDTIYSRYIYRKCDADEEVPEFVRIRKNGGEWHKPLVEVK